MLNINMMTVEECAQRLEMNPRTVREAIDNKTFPFGIMMKSRGGQKIYKISRRAFEKWFNGEEITACYQTQQQTNTY